MYCAAEVLTKEVAPLRSAPLPSLQNGPKPSWHMGPTRFKGGGGGAELLLAHPCLRFHSKDL